MTDVSSMQISKNTLDKLHDLKKRGDTYEDVILMLLQVYGESNTSENHK